MSIRAGTNNPLSNDPSLRSSPAVLKWLAGRNKYLYPFS